MQIKIKNFIDDFSEGVKNTIQKGNPKVAKGFLLSMGLVTALSGCQMTPQYEDTEMLINRFEQLTESQKPVKIDENNIEEIFTEGVSGVYQHPYDENNVMTLLFTNDKGDAESRIEEDLEKYGLDKSSFDWQYQLLDQTMFLGSQSRHVQDPTNSYSDINLTRMSHYDFYEKVDSDNDSSSHLEFNKLAAYHLLHHEAGHSWNHQQLSYLEYAKLLINQNKLIELEVSSEVGAWIKTFQYAKQMDMEKEFDQFYGSTISKVTHITLDEKGHITGDLKKDIHQQLPAYAVFDKLRAENEDILLNMSNKQIERLSEFVSAESIKFDFKEDYLKSLKNNKEVKELSTFAVSLSQLKQTEPVNFEGMKQATTDNLKNSKTLSGLNKVYKQMEDVFNAIEGKEEIIAKYTPENADLQTFMKEYIVKRDLKGNSELMLGNFETNHLLGKVKPSGMKNFAKETVDKIKLAGLLEPVNIIDRQVLDLESEIAKGIEIKAGNIDMSPVKTTKNSYSQNKI